MRQARGVRSGPDRRTVTRYAVVGSAAVATMLLWLGLPMAAAGQAPPPAQGQVNPPGAGRAALPPRAVAQADTPGEVQRLFDAYTVMQAQQVLGLDDARFASFLPRLRELQRVRRTHDRARQQLVARLGRLAGADTSDDAQLREALASLADLDGRYAADLRRAYDALDEPLDLRQRARFRQFEQQIERRKFDLILRARENRR